ncbi:mg2+ transporter zinc transport protein [Stemphylium lycopersici]|uniref:Mg2+ transporter zinc transport protein n=1 Tax=Stemphylium lycopersici TaxID=183478 RepID=A0A364N7C6_STELY|nr:mg2+ transporter zinc transport protein [Stemphylium lycopersici]RAR02613.1 mg2+ transporter zinc transport protein [Stemphylium lycopersici]RAR13137.1 mg2+ transporter zinc transport protein [Stemphylium lycopersici]
MAEQMASTELEALKKQLESLQRSHDALLSSLSSTNDIYKPSDASQLRRASTRHGGDAVFADTSTLSDDSDNEEDDFFVQNELPSHSFDHEHLRDHLRNHDWKEHGREILSSLVSDRIQLAKQPHLFHLDPSPTEDPKHHPHFQVYNVGPNGLPNLVEVIGPDNNMSSDIWHSLKDIGKSQDEAVVGRITIAREPSPILFGALHLTLHDVFDMDELFQNLVETEASSAQMFRSFDEDPKHQRSFFFNFEYYTIIGEDCKPMQWQRADKITGASDHHIPLSRCSAVVALTLYDEKPRRVRNRGRRAKTRFGWVHDVWSPWQVLQIECFPDWKSTPANGTPYTFETGHKFLNGAEAFLHSLLTEYRDARKRYDEIYRRITNLVTPPLGFLFDEELRRTRLFEDKDFTWTRRYFYAHQTLGNVNNSIKSMIDAFEDTFTDDIWEGTNKTLWPLFEESPRNDHWKRRLRLLRLQFEREMKELRTIIAENNERRHEIETLQEQLFSGTSIQESRKSVELADVTVHQGYNIKVLTIVNLFFMPLTFVTSVFGMTNMPENAPFGNFGIVLAAICIPFFSIIGFLSTKYGYSIWAQKTKELWRWIHPKKKREKLGDDEDVTQPPGPVNRTLSTEEGMRLRLKERDREHLRPRRRSTHRPPPSHPHIQRMVEKMGEGRESGLVRMGTVAEDKNSNAGTVQPGIRRGDTVITIQEP